MRKLVVWFNPKKGVYYHRIVRGTYLESSYFVGFENQYGHIIVHVIDNFDFDSKRLSFKQRIINKSISYLRKF